MLASDDGVLTAWADEQLAADEPEGAARVLALRLLAEVGTFGTGSFPVPIPGAVAPGPLAGLTVLVTRARDQAAALSNALREQGAEPLELPTIRIEEPLDSAPLDRALDGLNAGAYDWIVFTSANAATRLLARMAARGAKPVWPDGVKVAAVGEATATSLSRSGVGVDFVPARFEAAAVVRELVADGIAGSRVLFPRADIARDVLVDGLSAAGALVEPVEVYRTVVETEIEPEVRTRLRRGEVDVVTFASPSSARNLAALLRAERPALRRATVACIGQVTADAAVAAGWRVDVVAGDSTVAGLVAAIGEYVRVRADRRRPTANGHEDACEPAPVGVGAEA
jgi:uroporphyrinogen-III synthase